MNLFRRQGFHATSMPRLTARLGIGNGSLYAAFGSKDGLYADALMRYCDGLVGGIERDLHSGADVRTALRGLLIGLAAEGAADPERGCLLIGAVTERADHDATVRQVRSALDGVESALAQALRRAQDRGEVPREHRPEELACFLTTFLQGLRVMARARAGQAYLESAVDGALRVLD